MKGGTDAGYRLMYNFVNDKGGVCHDRHHPSRIHRLGTTHWKTSGSLLQKYFEVSQVCNEAGFIQEPSAKVVRLVKVYIAPHLFVSKYEAIANVNLKRIGLSVEDIPQLFF